MDLRAETTHILMLDFWWIIFCPDGDPEHLV